MKPFFRRSSSRTRRATESASTAPAESRRPRRRSLRTARCVLTDEHRFLLVVHAGAGRSRRPRWGLPGGHIDPGEGPETAVCRELREELELEVPAVHFVDDYRYKGSWHRVYTAAHRGRIERFDQNELLDVGWFALDEVAELAARGALHAGYEIDVVRRLSLSLPEAV